MALTDLLLLVYVRVCVCVCTDLIFPNPPFNVHIFRKGYDGEKLVGHLLDSTPHHRHCSETVTDSRERQ